MGSKKAGWINHFKLGPLCDQCGANMRFVSSVTNTLRLLLNILTFLVLSNMIPVRYRCPKCGSVRSTPY